MRTFTATLLFLRAALVAAAATIAPVPEYHDAMPVDYIEPGETTIVSVDGFPVAVANAGGEYFAFQSLCPHQGTTLGGRPLEQGCFITCSQHSSRYDVR